MRPNDFFYIKMWEIKIWNFFKLFLLKRFVTSAVSKLVSFYYTQDSFYWYCTHLDFFNFFGFLLSKMYTDVTKKYDLNCKKLETFFG